MVFWFNTIVGPAWRDTQSTAGTGGGLFGSPTWATQTATTTSTIYYQNTISQTASTTMGLYNTPTWTDQWVSPLGTVMHVRQPRIDPQIERELNALYRNEVAAPAIIQERHAALCTAQGRARELLLSYLSDDQRRTFEEHGWFIVLGGRSGRRYRISGRSYAGNVSLLRHDNDNVEASFCGHCDASIPLGDQLLAQKVMLEVDEPAYIALANRRAA